ncbi:hypothetical protein [Paenibacillus sp. y28]
MNDEVNWKAYEMYCIACCQNRMSPLSFEKWLFLVSDDDATS